MNHAALSKLRRVMDAAAQNISNIFTKPDDDPVWTNEHFWEKRWPAMVDRYGVAVEEYSIAHSEYWRSGR